MLKFWRLTHVLVLILPWICTPAWAQVQYPQKPVRVIVPFPPGQATDLCARWLADGLSKLWDQKVFVENRAGGAGIPGMLAGRDSSADGYTITFGTSGTVGVNPSLYSKLPYQPLKDFAMVHGVFIAPVMLVAHPRFPYSTVAQLVEGAKKEPGKINWGYAGIGTSQHLSGELFRFRTGIELTGVPYKGSGPMLQDLLGGQVLLAVDTVASALPQIKGGKIKAIAVMSLQRMPPLPDVPTVAESGYPGFEGVGWGGLVVPMGTPVEIIEKISTDVSKVLGETSMRERFFDRGLATDMRGPKEWTDFVRSEIQKWGEIVHKANVKVE